MKDMARSWIETFKQNYFTNLNLIIESFTIYYGEEYRSFICEIFQNIKMDFMLSEDALDSLECDTKIVECLKNYFESLNSKLKELESISSEDRLLQVYIEACSLKEVDSNSYEFRMMNTMILNAFIALIYYDPDDKPTVIFPLFLANEKVLFHELNHLVRSSRKGACMDSIFPSEEMEELINDVSSKEIRETFHELGGKISIGVEELDYDGNFDLIIDFYQSFKDLIKKASMEHNRSLLYDELGRKYVHRLYAMVKKLASSDTICKDDQKKIKWLIEKMKEEYKKDRQIISM